jgi:hypothetical protein
MAFHDKNEYQRRHPHYLARSFGKGELIDELQEGADAVADVVAEAF